MNPYYKIENVIGAYSGRFHSYGDRRNWPEWNGPKIRPDPNHINLGRRKHKRIPMTMDEITPRQMAEEGKFNSQLSSSKKKKL